ncbi:MAG: hypothetical protein HZA50_13825 [Planctomycetes bacterium]|nr:hypothetical protein [Planctomycetota bacterium]
MTALNEIMLEKMRRRRSAGESVGELAREVGMSWQRLWSLIYPNGCKPGPAPRGSGPLTERYRPLSLEAIRGQESVVESLRKFLAEPYPAAFMFEGDTGTGKTSAAMALAAGLGCDLSQKPPEFGGLHVIASGEQTADAVRGMYELMFR